MNPSVNGMNLTQDMKKLNHELLQKGAIRAGHINYQNSEQDKPFIKKNLNARTMRNTLQGAGKLPFLHIKILHKHIINYTLIFMILI